MTNCSCVPARRSPLTWEIDDPVPPVSSTDMLINDPRAQGRLAQVERVGDVADGAHHLMASALILVRVQADLHGHMVPARVPDARDALLVERYIQTLMGESE